MADAMVAAPNRDKAVNLSVTVFQRHHELVEEVRRARTLSGAVIPNKSDVVKDAIESLARRELDAERFEKLMAGAAS